MDNEKSLTHIRYYAQKRLDQCKRSIKKYKDCEGRDYNRLSAAISTLEDILIECRWCDDNIERSKFESHFNRLGIGNNDNGNKNR